MPERKEAVKKFLKLLNEIEQNKPKEKVLQLTLKNGSMVLVVVLMDGDRPFLKLVKPSTS